MGVSVVEDVPEVDGEIGGCEERRTSAGPVESTNSTGYELGWDGRPLTGPTIGFDTETDATTDLRRAIPELVICQVSDGERTVILPWESNQIEQFILVHFQREWVGFNSAFDFWVLVKYLQTHPTSCSSGAEDILWSVADRGRLHDLMYLDMLVRLAKGPGSPTESTDLQPRNLAEVACEYTGLRLNKEDPYRLRFGELLTIPFDTWGDLNPAWFKYAAKDALATVMAWNEVRKRARDLDLKNLTPTVDVEKYGLLTETLQTRASIALADIGRRGIGVDLTKVQTVTEKLRQEVTDHINWLDGTTPGLFKKYKKDGRFQLTPGAGLPRQNQSPLIHNLTKIKHELDLDVPLTEKKKQISLSQAVWEELAPEVPFVQHWAGMGSKSKLLQFLAKMKEDRVYPSYRTLVKTGRTSAKDPSIQNQPRVPWFREMFVPGPGYLLASIDYSAIELRTLAVICRSRFGHSVLGDVIEKGVDPHEYTAALVLDVRPEEFREWKLLSPGSYKLNRQSAKAINFGVPGGLGAAKLAMYAKANYDVTLTIPEAGALRHKLINDIYPEIGEYLQYDPLVNLALTTGRTADEVGLIFSEYTNSPDGAWGRICEKVVRGFGETYSSRTIDSAWGTVEALVTDQMGPVVKKLVRNREPSMWLAARLFSPPVSTLTGRIRGLVTFTESRNTPFQGLAADGAKLALWNLLKDQYRVVAFVHDEFVIEVKDQTEADRAAEVVKSSMSEVLGGFPVGVEVCVDTCWRKP